MSELSERYSIFAVTAPGLESLVFAELAELGIQGEVEAGGVAWEGDLTSLCRANLELRVASRVLVRVAEFRARTFYELERHAKRIPWERYVSAERAVRVRATCHKSRLYHEGAVEERLMTAIAQRTGATAAATGGEEDSEGLNEQLFIVRFLHDRAVVSADSSGALLHLRGYRQAVAKAPLRETLAAALLRASGWQPSAPLLDPMCGAGTIAIEAALLARHIPPGLASDELVARRYAMQEWPEFDDRLWTGVVDRAREGILAAAPAPIHGSDRDAGAVEAARANARRAGVVADTEFVLKPLSAVHPPAGRGWLVTNPPYGLRLGESEGLRDLYASLGHLARRELPGWTLALLSADRRLEGQVGVRWTEALRTRNGGIPVRVVAAGIPENES
jgi:putative N6-adenine-specific DNA methylase